MVDEENRTVVKDVVIELDGGAFFNQKFESCRLVYKGGTMPVLDNVVFSNSTFVFAGAAQNTLAFLQMMRDTGGKEMVDTMFEVPAHG